MMVIGVLLAALVAATTLGVAIAAHNVVLAWLTVGASVAGLLLLIIDSRRRRSGGGPGRVGTAFAELFDTPGVQRDLTREERLIAADMHRAAVPHEEAVNSLLPARRRHRRRHGRRHPGARRRRFSTPR